jgi:probable H4MPT-linked C1 transfer pathway protein
MTEAIGWDLGGAHIKAARLDPSGWVERVVQLPCPLWQGMDRLDAAVAGVRAALGDAPLHAITMTGEMVDLFADRREGVTTIARRAQALLGGQCRFFAGPAGFVSLGEVETRAPEIASANWRASAELVARLHPAALLVDIGSTTTDIIPIVAGRVASHGANDAERLLSRELVYTGVVRTPVMAMAPAARVQGEEVPIVAEYFAAAADVYRLTGQLPDGADQHPAADGGPKTPPASARRLARMVGRDADSAPLELWLGLARDLADRQARHIGAAIALVAQRVALPSDAPVIAAGVGRFVAAGIAAALARPMLDFSALVPAAAGLEGLVSDCAPAVAVARLARDPAR